MHLDHRDRKPIITIGTCSRHRMARWALASLRLAWEKPRVPFLTTHLRSVISWRAAVAPWVGFPYLTKVAIHEVAKVEGHCVLMQQVTFSQTVKPDRPITVLGGHIGLSAAVRSCICISQNALLRVSVDLLLDMSENATAVGVPERITPRLSDLSLGAQP